jgi:hypothetical protein
MADMKKSPLVLAVAVLLFGGWVTYLGVTALHNKQPTVVSRAQLALSQYDVEADLSAGPQGLSKQVSVKSVRWAADGMKPSGEITVWNLPSAQGYLGPGTYLLPLIRQGREYELAGVPNKLDPTRQTDATIPPRIYPDSPEVWRQWDQIRGTP